LAWGVIHSAQHVGHDNASELATQVVEREKPLLELIK
jgi:hypothetical protein